MRVLLVSNFFDGTGYSHAAADTAMALDAAGVDVVCRSVTMGGVKGASVPPRVAELLSKAGGGIDVALQYTLPPAFWYCEGVKNVGYYFTEASDFKSSGWPRYVNSMDEAWVACRHNLHASRRSGVTVPVSVLPCATDTSKFLRSYKPHRIRQELADSFLFYYVGEANRRKNLAALLTAFHLEFSPSEPVELVLKTWVGGMSPGQARETLRKEFSRVKARLNLYRDVDRYKEEILITEYLPDEAIYRLHNSCDCFVSASMGEGWGLGEFDAMGFGKTPIVGKHTAHTDWLSPAEGWLVKSHEEPVAGMPEMGDLYTGRQLWYSPSVAGLRGAMREAFEARGSKSAGAMAEASLEKALTYSHDNVGRLMRKALEDTEGVEKDRPLAW